MWIPDLTPLSATVGTSLKHAISTSLLPSSDITAFCRIFLDASPTQLIDTGVYSSTLAIGNDEGHTIEQDGLPGAASLVARGHKPSRTHIQDFVGISAVQPATVPTLDHPNAHSVPPTPSCLLLIRASR